MATWQQAGNSGALLAGLGGMNSNAPRASDADATLAYIRQNNEMERSGRNNVGLQALQGISSVMDMYKQMDQQKRQKEFQQAYADAYTSGDRDAMRKLASQYPEQFDAVRNGMKFVDEDQRSTVGTLAASARLAASSPEAMMSWLQNNSSELTRAGVDPLDVAKMYQQNPQGFTEFVDHLGMAALGPIDYFNVQDKMVGRQQDQQRINETIRNNDMTNARGWASNNIAQQNVNLRRMELEDKKYDRLIANETNALKLAELQDKRLQNQQAMEQAKRDKADAYNSGMDNLSRTIETATKVLNSPDSRDISEQT